jgi:hypothetical protein
MDPVAIVTLTGTCLAIARNATGFAIAISSLRDRYNDVGLSITAINARTGLLRSAADRLREWLDGHGARLQERERQAIRDSVEACELLVSTLRTEAERALRGGPDGSRQPTFWGKLRFLWRQERLDQYEIGIDHQLTALNYYLQTLRL